MTVDPTAFELLHQAELRLRARVLDLEDAEASALSFQAFQAADLCRSPRMSTFWTSLAILLQEELVRRDAIYAKAFGEVTE